MSKKKDSPGEDSPRSDVAPAPRAVAEEVPSPPAHARSALVRGNASEAAEPQAEERRQPAEWADRLGHIKRADKRIPQQRTHYDWQHAAADKLHGWSWHAYHYQSDPLLLTREDYEAALKAAAEYPVVPAHQPAMSPHKQEKA